MVKVFDINKIGRIEKNLGSFDPQLQDFIRVSISAFFELSKYDEHELLMCTCEITSRLYDVILKYGGESCG